MSNKEYAEEMRKAAENWNDIMPVTKELWLQVADRIEASPDPLAVQQESRKSKQVVITTAGSEESWFRRLFFQRFEEEAPKKLPDFDWGELT